MAPFGKLYDGTRGRLSRVLAAVRGEPTGARPTQPVRIKLGDLPAPLRAVVRDESHGGILIEAELPWLTVGSEVQAEFTDGREKAGRVHWFGVDATRAGSARLRIFVDLSSNREPISTQLPDVARRRRSRWPWVLATAFIVIVAASVAYAVLQYVKPDVLPSSVMSEPAPPRAPTTVAVPKQPPEPPPGETAAAAAPSRNVPSPKTMSPHPKRKKQKH